MALRKLRKFLLVLHVTTSVALIGGVLSFLVLASTGLAGSTAVYIATDIIAFRIVLPLSIAALGFGVIQSLVSPWGLFQHYWVVIKLAATTLVVGVLVLQLPGIEALANAVPEDLSSTNYVSGRTSLVLHASAGMVPLLACVVLSVFKPKGLTKYGWNKQRVKPLLS